MAEDPLAGDGVVRAEVAGQRLGQRGDLEAHPAFRQLGQLHAVALARDQRLDHRAPGLGPDL